MVNGMDTLIVFDESLREDILSIFGKTIDADGIIIEKDDPSQRVLTKDGEDINIKEFAGVKRGSEIFIKSDLISLIDFSKG